MTTEETNSETTPVWGYSPAGESYLFHLKGNELLPQGWYDSPTTAVAEGRNEAVERELRFELERRAQAVKLEINAAWTTERLQSEVHRAEVVEGSKQKVAPVYADPPKDAKQSDKVTSAEAAARTPPAGESGADLGVRNHRIEQQQKTAAKLLKEHEAEKNAASDEASKPTADEVAKQLAKAK